MRLKSFSAKTMTEAMQMVRDTLGEDAIIVATREEKGGVSITAAIEPAFELGRGGKVAEDADWLQYDDEDEEGSVAEELTDVLLRHSVPEDIMDQIISCASVMGVDEPRIALIAALEHLYSFAPLPTRPHKKAIMMIGPPGAGKTLAVAKMAARGVMNGLRVGVITTDSVRAGGVEQLQSFTKLLSVDLKKAGSAEDLARVLDQMDGMDQVIIDTAGVNPFHKQDVTDIATLIAVGDCEPVLVLPAGIDAEESAEMARIFAAIGTQQMISSRVDIARRLGGLLAAAYQGHLAFADAAHTPKVADGLLPVSAKTLASMLMPGSAKSSNQAQTPPQRMRARQ